MGRCHRLSCGTGGKTRRVISCRFAGSGMSRPVRREDYIAPGGIAGGKVPVLPSRPDRPPVAPVSKKPNVRR